MSETESAQEQVPEVARCVECQRPVAHPDDDLCLACGERIATAKDNAEFERLRRTDTSDGDE